MYTGFNGIFDVVNRTINVKKGIEHMFCAERDREREAMVYFILSPINSRSVGYFPREKKIPYKGTQQPKKLTKAFENLKSNKRKGQK